MDNQSQNSSSPLQPPAPPRPLQGNPQSPVAANSAQLNSSGSLKTYNATQASKEPIAPPPSPEDLAKEIAHLSSTINVSAPQQSSPSRISTAGSPPAPLLQNTESMVPPAARAPIPSMPPVPTPKPVVPPMASAPSNNNKPPAYVADVNKAIAPPSSKKSWKMPIIIIALLIIIAGAIFGVYQFIGFENLFGKKEIASTPVTLTYWGLWEPKEVMDPIIKDYEKANPNVTIKYQVSSPTEYAQRLRSALKSENPPDIFRIHNTWVYMFQESLSRMPDAAYTQEQFDQTFYPVASSNLRVGDSMVGIPLMFDGLSLYYNVDLFTKAGVQPPTDWNSFVTAAEAIRAPRTGPVEIAGAAIGTAGNIDHWPDILSVLMFQNLADPGNPTSQLAYDALTFYSMFSYRYNTWDQSWPAASEQFAIGKVGMFFGPSWQVHNIKKISKENNYQLNFKIIPIPQLPGSNVTWGSFWAESVSAKSPNQDAAWKFLKYLSQKDTMLKMYELQSKYSPDREFGEIPSRRDLADQFKDHPYIGPYIIQAEAARSYPLVSSTLDKDGINDQIIRYYTDAVNKAATGTSPDAALGPTAKGVKEVLKTYGLAL